MPHHDARRMSSSPPVAHPQRGRSNFAAINIAEASKVTPNPVPRPELVPMPHHKAHRRQSHNRDVTNNFAATSIAEASKAMFEAMPQLSRRSPKTTKPLKPPPMHPNTPTATTHVVCRRRHLSHTRHATTPTSPRHAAPKEPQRGAVARPVQPCARCNPTRDIAAIDALPAELLTYTLSRPGSASHVPAATLLVSPQSPMCHLPRSSTRGRDQVRPATRTS